MKIRGPLPGCMMPDGGDPCEAFTDAIERVGELNGLLEMRTQEAMRAQTRVAQLELDVHRLKLALGPAIRWADAMDAKDKRIAQLELLARPPTHMGSFDGQMFYAVVSQWRWHGPGQKWEKVS